MPTEVVHDRTARLAGVRESLQRQRAEWLLVAPSADFRWLTGAVARSTERLVLLALPARGAPFCLVPRLEAVALASECPWLEFEIWDEHEDPFARLAARIGLDQRPATLVSDGLRTATLLRLAAATPCRPAALVLEPLRAIKDADELARLAEAAAHADRVVEATAGWMRPGMTERQVARHVFEQFESVGDTDPWAIVASGPNAALPHHFTSDRKLERGDVVLLDLGASTGGYGSDITRTCWLGEPSAEERRVFDVVNAARQAGIAAVRAGEICENVDRAARAVIEAAGYGAHFTHRTGHGVGLEIHEPPYLVAGNRAPLARGMVHSVEPGIYLEGRFGVRIEDLVVVEDGAARRLNRAPIDPRPPGSRP
jgi:D-alanyl-D-alanine dipeptidase